MEDNSNVVDLSSFAPKDKSKLIVSGPIADGVVIQSNNIIPITGEISTWVINAIREVTFTDDVHYHVDIALVPGPAGPQPAVTILCAIDSPLIGQKLSAMTMVPTATPPQIHVAEATKNLVNNLMEQRRELMASLDG